MKSRKWDFCKDLIEARNRRKGLKDQNDELKKSRIKTLTQAEWHNFKKIRAELKAMLPTIPPAEARRFHLQRDEAIVDELLEKELHFEANFFKELVEFNEERRKADGPGTITWNRPRLKDQYELLDRLKEALIIIGNARKSDEPVKATDTWIQLSLSFQSEGENWWWLTKKLYQSTLKMAESITDDNEKNLTLVRYLYGRFLFIAGTDWLEALELLDAAREASEKRIWNASKIVGEKQETIFRESCALMYKILILLVRELGQDDPNFAIEACNEALLRATDTCHDDYVIDALYELGRNHLRHGDVKHALQDFAKLLAMAKRIPDPEGICNAHMELAFAYKEIDDTLNTEKRLDLFRETAVQYNLPDKLARAHYYTGEHYLNQMKANLATAHLEKSFALYHDLGSTEEADRVRIIAGISRGQEKIEQYIDMILQCGECDGSILLKICAWKSDRTPFWTDALPRTETDIFYEHCEESTPASSSISNSLTRFKPKL